MLRLQMLGEGYDELQIFSDFMKAERKLQKAMERMHKPEETDSKKETGQQSQCANCGKPGHQTDVCWRKKKVPRAIVTSRELPSSLVPPLWFLRRFPALLATSNTWCRARTTSTTGAGSTPAPPSGT